jgi:NAD(P)-dependent dehydrogenase (short-subunit alcohol dehydrogenase family)
VPIAIVTGGNSGIGRATAVALAERGFDVGITWHEHEDRAQDALEEIRGHGVRAAARHMDLDEGFPGDAAAVEALMDELGGVDALVNNAGAGLMSPFLELDLETWQRTVNLVLSGAFLCAQAAARRMVEQGRGGRIVNVASTAAFGGKRAEVMDAVAYTASKGGVVSLTRDLAVKWARYGITVNALAPGWFPSDLSQAVLDRHEAELLGDIPLGRFGGDDDLKGAIALLASDASAFLTGQVLVVDGGETAQ